jgi:hypothetical protein
VGWLGVGARAAAIGLFHAPAVHMYQPPRLDFQKMIAWRKYVLSPGVSSRQGYRHVQARAKSQVQA